MIDLVTQIERLNTRINELENGYGRGPFYDGAIRDRLQSLWSERDVLGEQLRALTSDHRPNVVHSREK